MTAQNPRQHSRTRFLIATVAASLAALLVGVFVAPQRQVVGPETAGDADLAAQVRAAADGVGGFRSVAIAEVTPDDITWAGLGNSTAGRSGPAPGADTVFETGSVAKTFTAALFADAIERGEVSPDDPLAQHLPELEGTPAGEVTLASLAQHRSGLPPLGATAQQRATVAVLTLENPYETTTTEQLIADATQASVNPEQPPTYSNFAISLLGTALARTSGHASWSALLAERITGPLGMSDTTPMLSADDLPDGATDPFVFNGTPAPRWYGEGYQPSGTSMATTIHDMALWAQAQLNGTAPGGDAPLEPTAEMQGSRIGWAWLTTEIQTTDGEATLVWHNGSSAGHTAMLGIDPDTDRAVVVLGNTNTPVDTFATAVLHDGPVLGQPMMVTVIGWLLAALAAALSGVTLWRAFRGRSVLSVVALLLISAAGLAYLWHSGPWNAVGGWLWGLAFAPALAAIPVLALRTALAPKGTTAVPFRPTGSAQVPWLGVALGVLLIIGVTQLW
ncbi:MAG TPA: beta-lactamase family protein [Candidatus Avipropionibacterium avicola]|uniref:Beta-lactamase family protein n=1 Tax=Candidatus Avipropionibacterium avicola TaxID=2840701 RepID=A0A9D1H0H7_9ACTN|nr:beta-lactamase family protein [Candidatus Avipropionibacterium avicola]